MNHHCTSTEGIDDAIENIISAHEPDIESTSQFYNKLSGTDDIMTSLAKRFTHEKPSFGVLLQQLNHDRILAKRDRIQSVKELKGRTFIRFYEFHKNSVVFNILELTVPLTLFSVTQFLAYGRLAKRIQNPEYNKRTVNLRNILTLKKENGELRPVLRDELLHATKAAGFCEIQTYGSIALDDFQQLSSKDLVVLAHKPAATN